MVSTICDMYGFWKVKHHVECGMLSTLSFDTLCHSPLCIVKNYFFFQTIFLSPRGCNTFFWGGGVYFRFFWLVILLRHERLLDACTLNRRGEGISFCQKLVYEFKREPHRLKVRGGQVADTHTGRRTLRLID